METVGGSRSSAACEAQSNHKEKPLQSNQEVVQLIKTVKSNNQENLGGNKSSTKNSFHSRTGATGRTQPMPVPYPAPPWAETLYSLLLLDNQSNATSIQNSQVYPLHQSLVQTGLNEAEGALYGYSSMQDAVTTESQELLCHPEGALKWSIGLGQFLGWNSSRNERPRKIGRKIEYGLIRLIAILPIPKSLHSTLPQAPLSEPHHTVRQPGHEPLSQPAAGTSSYQFEGLNWRVFGAEQADEPAQRASTSPLAAAKEYIEDDLRASRLSTSWWSSQKLTERNEEGSIYKPARLRAQEEKTNQLLQEVEELELRLLRAKHQA